MFRPGLSGCFICKRNVRERKYLVRGESLGGSETTVVTRLGITILVIITVYPEED